MTRAPAMKQNDVDLEKNQFCSSLTLDDKISLSISEICSMGIMKCSRRLRNKFNALDTFFRECINKRTNTNPAYNFICIFAYLFDLKLGTKWK